MGNRGIKNESQVLFFDQIQKVLPANYALVDVISDVLDIGSDSAYRRIRGDKLLDFNETITLCKHFRISLDSIVGITAKNQIECLYTPMDLSNANNFITYLNTLLSNMKNIRLTQGGEVLLSASDIPLFGLSMFKDLAFFKLFSWGKNVYGFSGSYEEFVNGLDTNEFLKFCNEIANNYQLIPTTEIWSSNTIDTFLNSVNYHYETDSFNNRKFPIYLCEQLLELINILHKWTEEGQKYPKETSFKFYVNEIGIENSFFLFRLHEKTKCMIKLYTVNGLTISDRKFCEETENWLHNLAQRALLISGGSAKERHKFFANQRQKIRYFMDSCFERDLECK